MKSFALCMILCASLLMILIFMHEAQTTIGAGVPNPNGEMVTAP